MEPVSGKFKKVLRERRGADIEIIDRSSGDTDVLVPSTVRINGAEILIPSGATIRVHDISDHELVTVTLTVFARSVSIRHEPKPETGS
ncbi:hypothetical protein [Streptomyces sp. NPDC056670]|uniref:hypothetical protein n=1 Tax=Streptomyces sp. NPDC056670 TaxID=3345904 RepID=UPI00368B4B33